MPVDSLKAFLRGTRSFGSSWKLQERIQAGNQDCPCRLIESFSSWKSENCPCRLPLSVFILIPYTLEGECESASRARLNLRQRSLWQQRRLSCSRVGTARGHEERRVAMRMYLETALNCCCWCPSDCNKVRRTSIDSWSTSCRTDLVSLYYIAISLMLSALGHVIFGGQLRGTGR